MIAALYLSGEMARYERRVVTVLEEFCKLINYAKNQIDIYSAPREDILRSASREGEFLLELENADSFAQAVEKNADYLRADAKRELLAFSSELGSAYREEQVKRCEYYLEVIDKIKRDAQDALHGKIKMYRTLILSLAIGIILVLW